MKNAQNATPARNTLVEFVYSLAPYQAENLAMHLSLLDQLKGMSENELIFAETFLRKVCGGKSE